MQIFIVQRIDLDLRSMRYIKTDIIIIDIQTYPMNGRSIGGESSGQGSSGPSRVIKVSNLLQRQC